MLFLFIPFIRAGGARPALPRVPGWDFYTHRIRRNGFARAD